MVKGGIQTNRPEGKKIDDDDDDDAQGLTCERWHRYGSGKDGGRELTSIEDCMDASIQGLVDYIKTNKERLITIAGYSTDNTRTKRPTKTKKQKWEEK